MGKKEKWPKVYVTGVPEGEKRKKKETGCGFYLSNAFLNIQVLLFLNVDHYLTSYIWKQIPDGLMSLM